MKCPNCQSENYGKQTMCQACGAPLNQPLAKTDARGKSGPVARAPGVAHEDVARKLKLDYIGAVRDHTDRSLDSIQDLLEEVGRPRGDAKELLDGVAKLIYKQFHVREVAIGLKSPDGLYRYVTMHGMRANIWAEHRDLAYSYDAFFDNVKYKGTVVSDYTKLLLAEDMPYDEGEKQTYSEHLMKSSVRKALDDSIEGDYLDILIYGIGNELLGWIEISGTWEDKLPSARTIRCLEIVANITGMALSHRGAIPRTDQKLSP
jgi:hypothetical protein